MPADAKKKEGRSLLIANHRPEILRFWMVPLQEIEPCTHNLVLTRVYTAYISEENTYARTLFGWAIRSIPSRSLLARLSRTHPGKFVLSSLRCIPGNCWWTMDLDNLQEKWKQWRHLLSSAERQLGMLDKQVYPCICTIVRRLIGFRITELTEQEKIKLLSCCWIDFCQHNCATMLLLFSAIMSASFILKDESWMKWEKLARVRHLSIRED